MRGAILRTDALRHNLNCLRQTLSAKGEKADMIAVLKANAYGHGAARCAPLVESEASAFALATVEEAIALRAVTEKPLLVLGYVPPNLCTLLYNSRIFPSVFSLEYAHALEKEIRHAKSAKALPSTARLAVHIKVDTGMRRLGLSPDPSLLSACVGAWAAAGHIQAVGIYSHFAHAEDAAFTAIQQEKFKKATSSLHLNGISTHFSASAALLRYGAMGWNAVRPGIALWGYGSPALRPVMRIFAHPVQTRCLEKGEALGYQNAFRAPASLAVATLPFGYGDGLLRAAEGAPVLWLTPQGECHGGRIVGNICMDFCFCITTDGYVPTCKDAVLFFPAAIARQARTIPYEVLCRLGERIPRFLCASAEEEKGCIFPRNE